MATAGVFEGGQRVAGVCFESGQAGCQVGLAVAAVLCDHQAPTQGVTRTDRIGGAEGEAIGLQRERDRIRVAGGLGGIDLDRSRRPSPHRRNGERQREERGCPSECVRVVSTCEFGAVSLDRPFGLADELVCSAEQALHAVRHLVAPTADHHCLTGVAVADSGLDPSGQVALRRHHVQSCEPGMADCGRAR